MENEEKNNKKTHHLRTFAAPLVVAWVIGTFAFIYFYPQQLYKALENEIIQKGLGSGSGIPVNTLYAVPNLASPSIAKSNVLIDGTNHDTLYDIGSLDLSKGPQVLHVPDMAGRYYSIEFVDPKSGTDFAYVGRRTNGTAAGDYLIAGPGWNGTMPSGMTQISSPGNSVLVLGRILVYSDSDVSTAYDFAKQIELTPLGQWLVSGSQGIPAK